LVKKGLPFRDAYMVVGRLVNMCIKMEENLETLTLKDFRSVCDKFDDDIYEVLQLKTCVNERKVIGGPSREAVSLQIKSVEEFINERTQA
ncbi:MAG: argininosuccinate lyase, partial [Oscillospiraceae bacterium]